MHHDHHPSSAMDQQHPSMEQGTAHAIAKEHRQKATHRSEEMKQQKLLEKQKYPSFILLK